MTTTAEGRSAAEESRSAAATHFEADAVQVDATFAGQKRLSAQRLSLWTGLRVGARRWRIAGTGFAGGVLGLWLPAGCHSPSGAAGAGSGVEGFVFGMFAASNGLRPLAWLRQRRWRPRRRETHR